MEQISLIKNFAYDLTEGELKKFIIHKFLKPINMQYLNIKIMNTIIIEPLNYELTNDFNEIDILNKITLFQPIEIIIVEHLEFADFIIFDLYMQK